MNVAEISNEINNKSGYQTVRLGGARLLFRPESNCTGVVHYYIALRRIALKPSCHHLPQHLCCNSESTANLHHTPLPDTYMYVCAVAGASRVVPWGAASGGHF